MNIVGKLKNFINKRVLKTPGVEFLRKNKDLNARKKHINFWLNRAKKNKSLNRFFFTEASGSLRQLTYSRTDEEFKISHEMFESLSNNGLLIIENALPESERTEIIRYFDELRNNSKFSNKWLKKPHNPNFFNEVNEMMGQISVKNFKYLNEYSMKLSKEIYGKIVEPTVEFRYLKQKNNTKEKQVRGATYLHTDRFLPHFKVYYTPYKIEIDDAPLEYLLSSHKINKNFINFYLNAENFDETDYQFENFKLDKKIVCVPKNSLYIAFTNGFHKRSQFNSNSERSLVFLQYVQRFNKLDYLF